MIYYSHGVELGKQVWAWIKPKDEASHVPAQIKFMGLLPYQGFKYILPEETWKIVKDESRGEYIQTSDEMKESKHNAIFADTKNELVGDKISRLNREVEQLMGEINALQQIKD